MHTLMPDFLFVSNFIGIINCYVSETIHKLDDCTSMLTFFQGYFTRQLNIAEKSYRITCI